MNSLRAVASSVAFRFVLAGIVIVGGLWWFITAVQCDPMISDRAFTMACK